MRLVPDGDALHRTAAALRIALVGRVISRFDAFSDVGPVPGAGRVVESVEAHGRQLDIIWDDGLTLHTNMRLSGVWHLYRTGEMWRRPSSSMRVSLSTTDWVAVCFGAPVVETFREFDPRRHPGSGRLGPDLATEPRRASEAIAALFHYPEPNTTVADALLDLHVVRGVGSVFRSEVLWQMGLHPAATLGQLDDDEITELIDTASSIIQTSVRRGHRMAPLAVYRRTGQSCGRCREAIEERVVSERQLFWCPGCQVRHDPAELTPPSLDRPMDPHPAAAKFLAELPWRRDPLAG